MPVHHRKDKEGCYAQWGNHGRKYYYNCQSDRAKANAEKKAALQGRAAYAAGYKGE